MKRTRYYSDALKKSITLFRIILFSILLFHNSSEEVAKQTMIFLLYKICILSSVLLRCKYFCDVPKTVLLVDHATLSTFYHFCKYFPRKCSCAGWFSLTSLDIDKSCSISSFLFMNFNYILVIFSLASQKIWKLIYSIWTMHLLYIIHILLWLTHFRVFSSL